MTAAFNCNEGAVGEIKKVRELGGAAPKKSFEHHSLYFCHKYEQLDFLWQKSIGKT